MLAMTALILDDDPVTRRTLIRRLPFETRAAAYVEEALVLAHKWLPAVILVDVNLGPGISGLDAIELLRDVSPASQIIVMSGLESVADRDVALAMGARYVAKKDPVLLGGVALAALTSQHVLVHGPSTVQ